MNLSDKALQVIRTVAPMLATALGGPLAGTATTLILGKLGGDSKDAKAAEAAIAAGDPATLAKLQEIEADLKKHLADLGVEEDKLAFADTADARAREVAVKDWTPRILAYAVVALTFAIEGLILIFGQPKSVDGVVLGRVLGTLDAATMLVLSYYFGTSASSRAKDDTLAQIAKQP